MPRLGKKLKIVVLGTRGFPQVQGGVEKHCEELYPRLAGLGCDVTVITRTPYIQKENRVTSWRNVKFIHLWCPKSKSFEALVHSLFAVLRARLLSPDILHIHSIGPALITPLARLSALPVVMTHHGPDYMRKKWGRVAQLALRTGEKLGVCYSNRIIAVSGIIQEHIKRVYDKTAVHIPNGVTMPSVLPADGTLATWGLEPRRYAFTASRFVPEKGLHDLINAYKLIESPRFKLVIAGNADHPTRYSAEIERSAAYTPGVVLTGFVSGNKLAQLFSNAALFVLPSYFEGLPIALLEAMSYGLPVAVSDIPQHREIPLSEKCYFPSDDVRAMAAVLRTVFEEGITNEEKERYRALISETYNWDRIAAETLSVYQEIL